MTISKLNSTQIERFYRLTEKNKFMKCGGGPGAGKDASHTDSTQVTTLESIPDLAFWADNRLSFLLLKEQSCVLNFPASSSACL